MNTFDFTSALAQPTVTPSEYENVPVAVEPVPVEQPAPEQTPEFSHYSFYVDPAGVKMGNYDQQSPEVCVDITFNISDNSGSSYKTCTVTKRLKFCKQALLNGAAFVDGYLDGSATVVEHKETIDQDKISQTTQRMLEMAGINHPGNYVTKGSR